MPKFAANLSLMFTEVPFLERFAAARAVGFEAVEFQFPYAFPAIDVAERARDNNLHVVLFNLPPGNFEKGERGIACLPGREDEFRMGIESMLDYAQALKCQTINCLVGIKPADLGTGAAAAAAKKNLDYAAEYLARENIQLVIEPLNQVDVPGFLISRSADAITLIDEVAHPNLKLQYDLYHMQRTEGELTATLSRLAPRIGHIQIADAPLRHEPGTGEISFAHMLRHIDAIGYAGWLGCEYKPRTTTVEGLRWIADLGFSL
jgi:hydroxypyruvate isomerase